MKERSNEVFSELLVISEIKGDTATAFQVKSFMAENYENMGDYEKALELCIQLYETNLKNNELADASYNLIQMGRISKFLETDTTYLEYYHMANDLAKRSGNMNRISNNLINTGIAYNKAGYPYKAYGYFAKAEELIAYETDYGRVYLYNAKSLMYFNMDSISQSYKYTRRAYKLASAIKAYNFIYHSSLRLASLSEKTGQLDSARVFMLNAVNLNKLLQNKSYSQYLYKRLSDLNHQLGEYQLALAYLDSSYMAYTSHIKETNRDKLLDLRNQSDYLIQRNRISELVASNNLEQEKNKKLIIIIFSILMALSISIYLALHIRKRLLQLRESYMNLVRKNIELDRLNKKLQACETRPARKNISESIKDEDVILLKLKKLLYREEIYIDNGLTLVTLADKLGTNTSYLSAIINSHFNCNFRTLINKYRIEKPDL